MQQTLCKYPLAQVNYGTEEIEAVIDALRAGQTTAGPRVKQFEQQFAGYIGGRHATMVNSGSSADLVVMLGLGTPDFHDEILVSAVTWPTQVWACLLAGYRVRLVDVDPETLQMSTADTLSKIDRRTKGIFLVHLLGAVGNLDPFLKLQQPNDLSLTIIEDCCEALGAKWRKQHVGTFGSASAFSFFFSHLISTMEGGMVVTHDDRLARDHKLLRNHGWEPQKDYRYWFPSWGLNVRPTEVQGAFGCVQLGRIENFRAARMRNVSRLAERTYQRFPSFLQGCHVLPECEPSWHGFPLVVLPDSPVSRDTLCARLEEDGIETRPIVAGNLARQPAICQHADRIAMGPLPGADQIHNHGFYIGVPSFDDESGIDYVGDIFARALDQA
jgi:CDP-6-deoxy-D-xylo-4-hexulose-3-dehydrase